jgi:hypothetical protein
VGSVPAFRRGPKWLQLDKNIETRTAAEMSFWDVLSAQAS